MDDVPADNNVEELILQCVGLKAQVRALQHELAGIYPEFLDVLRSIYRRGEVGGAIVSVQSRNT